MFAQALACGYILHHILFYRSLIKYPNHLLYFRILVIGLVWQFIIEFALNYYFKHEINPLVDDCCPHRNTFKDGVPLISASFIYGVYYASYYLRVQAIPVDLFLRKVYHAFFLLLKTTNYDDKIKSLNIGKCCNDAFDELLMRATYRDFPIMITTINNKIYVGWIAVFNLDDKLEWLSIIPLLSGYRTKEKKKVKFNVDYFKYYEEETSEEYLDVNLSIDKITSIQKFDYNFFKFNKTQRELQSTHQTGDSP